MTASAAPPLEFPSLSLAERDRRWENCRRLMRQHDVAALLVAGISSLWRLDGYLANEHAEGYVILPLHGDPVYLTWTPSYIARHRESVARGAAEWVRDWRIGTDGAGIATALRAMGLARARIGVIGISCGTPPIEPDGWIPYGTWQHVLEALPQAEFVHLSRQFIETMLTKSAEEVCLLRHAAAAGERACAAMMAAARVGALECEVYAQITATLFASGCDIGQGVLLHVGADNPAWGYPIWMSQSGRPRAIQHGDLVQAEIMPVYGGLMAQQQMSLMVGRASGALQQLADAARRSYEAALAVIRPGITFLALAEAMEVPIAAAECWHTTPLVHSLSPNFLVGHLRVGMERMPGYSAASGLRPIVAFGGSTVLEPGMAFALEPNVCRGGSRVNIGGTVLVTRSGVEELNSLSTRMHGTA